MKRTYEKRMKRREATVGRIGKRKRRRVLWAGNKLLGTVLAAGIVLTGCGQEAVEEREPETITVLAGQSTSDAGIEDMIDEWLLEKFPNVRLEWECVDWGDGFNAKIQGHFAAGDVPDLMIGKAQDVKTYAKTGNLGVIEERCSQKIEEEALEAVMVNGEVYGVPYNAWYQGVIYNKDIFRRLELEPPETEEEMKAVIQCLKDHDIVPFASHFQEHWKVANMTMQYLMNDIFCEIPDWGDQFREGKQDFGGNEQIRHCLENNKMILENSWEDALQLEQFESDSRFTQGEAAMYLTGSWSMQFANQYGKDIDFGIFPYPAKQGASKLLRETNLTFMKSADTQYGELIDDILYALLDDQKLVQEILGFTQSSSVIKGIPPAYHSKIQQDIDWYEAQGRVLDVSGGNSQLIWDFQNSFAAQQIDWLKKEKTLEEVLDYADRNRKYSSYLPE